MQLENDMSHNRNVIKLNDKDYNKNESSIMEIENTWSVKNI